MPFRLWLRQLAGDRVLMLHRSHFGAACRAIQREVALPDRSSLLLARQLLAPGSTPTQRLTRDELVRRVREAVARLTDADREVLFIRTFDGLSSEEAAAALGTVP